jgi:hypothetical protein
MGKAIWKIVDIQGLQTRYFCKLLQEGNTKLDYDNSGSHGDFTNKYGDLTNKHSDLTNKNSYLTNKNDLANGTMGLWNI